MLGIDFCRIMVISRPWLSETYKSQPRPRRDQNSWPVNIPLSKMLRLMVCMSRPVESLGQDWCFICWDWSRVLAKIEDVGVETNIRSRAPCLVISVSVASPHNHHYSQVASRLSVKIYWIFCLRCLELFCWIIHFIFGKMKACLSISFLFKVPFVYLF